MQLTLCIAIMQVTMSVAFFQVFKWYFLLLAFGGSFCYNYAGDCFCCNYAVRSFCSTYAGNSFCKKAIRIINLQPRNFHTSPLFKQNSILKFQDKICLENILFASKSLNNLSPSVFNTWFTLLFPQINLKFYTG